MSHKADVRFPLIREELFRVARVLADTSYQQQVWRSYSPTTPQAYDDFDMVVHFLYDDTNLADSSQSAIGDILLNEKEALGCSEIIAAIDFLLDRYGNALSDAEYISKPEWNNIVVAAQKLYSLLQQGEERGRKGDRSI